MSLSKTAPSLLAVVVVAFVALAVAPARADLVPPEPEPGEGESAPAVVDAPASGGAPSITVGEMDHHIDNAPKPAPATPTKVITSCAEIAPLDGDPNAIPADDDLRAKVVSAVARGELMLALLLVMFAGLLTALTPCVYPLIPITLAIFGARQTTPVRGFLLSATYVSGMVALYASLGTGFAAFGLLAGSSLQSPLVTLFVAGICIVMAASMFGAFEIALPGNMQTKLSQMGGTGFRGAFVMGLVAGVIAAPCTGPVLSFILTIIAKDGDVAKGALMMVFYALGIGIPFLVLGTFSTAIARMPKSGPWMETVKSIFGVLMLAVGLYYAQFAVPPLAELSALSAKAGLFGALALFAVGAAVGAFHLSFKYTTKSEQARKGVGVVFATAGLFSLVGWLMSEPAPVVVEGEAPAHIAWTVIAGEPDAVTKYDRLLDEAKTACKPVMIDFYADWCAACKELDKFTYVDPAVARDAQRFTTIKIDATTDTDALSEIQKRYGIVGLPTVVFIDSKGQVKESPRVTGFVSAKEYLPIMQRVR